MTQETTFIYALVDPHTDEIKYIGKSNDPERRLRDHLRCEWRNVYKDRWVLKLKRQGEVPVLHVLEECPGTEWRDRERYWIAALLEAGCLLSNRTAGGDGLEGYNHSPETRAKMSESTKKSWANPETRERQTVAIRAALADPAVRAKISAWRKTLFSDPERARQALAPALAAKKTSESRARASAARKKVWADPEISARRAATMRVSLSDPAVKAKLSKAAKAQWANPEMKEKMREALRAGWVKRRARLASP